MSSDADFTTAFDVSVDPEAAFEAAADPKAWWNDMITGTAGELGDAFIYDVPGLHHSEFEVVEARPGRQLAWKVVPSGAESELHEWLDTVVEFRFAPTPTGTRVTFTHHGLAPSLECHTVCTTAWTYHLAAGLRALLTEGRGAPITAASAADVARRVGAQDPEHDSPAAQ